MLFNGEFCQPKSKRQVMVCRFKLSFETSPCNPISTSRREGLEK